MADAGWRRLARVIEEEAAALRLSYPALARRSGFSVRTLDDLRAGVRTSYRPDTLGQLESGLAWEPGSIERVLAGLSPVRKPDPDLARIHHAWRNLSPDVRRALAEVAERLST